METKLIWEIGALVVGLAVGFLVGYLRADFVVNERWKANAWSKNGLWCEMCGFYKVIKMDSPESWRLAIESKRISEPEI